MKEPLRFNRPVSFLSVFLFLFLPGCSSDDNDPVDPELKQLQLTDFPLFEVNYLTINIVHPVIQNGQETQHGTIAITIPFSHQSLELSLKKFSLDDGNYSISPSVLSQQDFSDGPVTYTITENSAPNRTVHYDVSVEFGGEPFFQNKKVTGFKFEKVHNPQLAETIDAVKIAEYANAGEYAIYVIVPVGTDFSQLKPTITFDAAKLYYNNDVSFAPYPQAGVMADFKYPKHFYLQAENSIGERSLTYNVIVDVANPIRFDNGILITPEVTAGDNLAVENFFDIAEWTNQGNHPVTGMSPDTYTDKTFPATFPEAFTVITASTTNPVPGTPGVLPGEKGKVSVRIKKMEITGAYSAKAIFHPTFSFDQRIISFWPPDDRIEDIFSPSPLTIQSTIVE